MLEVRDLSKRYDVHGGVVEALAGVSLSVQPGEFVGVQGPSGCGKTTLLLAAGGLLACDGGQVIVAGRDPYEMPPDERARFRAETVGFVFQQFYLVPYLNVLENVLAPSLAVDSNGSADRARELIEHFGLSDRIRHKPGEMSTGERQRIALARALLNRPKLLLADEPTGNLDGASAETVLGYMTEFARDGGAVLLVTHDERAAAFADRIVRLDRGRLVEQ
ncbi:MAG: ABC transporter ATP-binding protein [Planctomycetes bacterium]|nr:ABC transporter ATP-binding protein [Planctomycetota bacterium]